ncbi:hypothetical protein GL4_3158 [Methyloceanibacter caenitepidi]|uniref:Uncharacterized protein n=1 Tax=Methyloceanibacter caenitepidi TaxID=1384459 RepID=A0A0A8K964_9HYPH|nr:hypothetical protein GL4_3158 [Methyloceanibacter caenitepidi]
MSTLSSPAAQEKDASATDRSLPRFRPVFDPGAINRAA